MDIKALLDLLIGPYGALVLESVVIYFLYRKSTKQEDMIYQLLNDRLEDAKDAKQIAEAYLRVSQEEEKRGHGSTTS